MAQMVADLEGDSFTSMAAVKSAQASLAASELARFAFSANCYRYLVQHFPPVGSIFVSAPRPLRQNNAVCGNPDNTRMRNTIAKRAGAVVLIPNAPGVNMLAIDIAQHRETNRPLVNECRHDRGVVIRHARNGDFERFEFVKKTIQFNELTDAVGSPID